MTAAKSTPAAKAAAPAPERPSPWDSRDGLEDWQRAALAKLREPFADHQVSLLPKQMRRDDPDKGRCERGTKYCADGRECGGWHARSIHLDYVGHAALTDRLLEADPFWTWEPLAMDDTGLPLFDRNGGLWIRLTVAGMTRLGYGDAQGKSGPNATKEAIGDGLRNAGMRFGAALDLWHKGDLHDASEQQGTPENPAPEPRTEPRPTQPAQTARNGAQSGAPDPGAGIDPERQAAWRRRVLTIEYLGADPKRDGKRDGGLRTAYQDARTDGVLGWPVDPGNPGQTFAELLRDLAGTLPEWPDESKDQAPADDAAEPARGSRPPSAPSAGAPTGKPDATDPDVPPWATSDGWGTDAEGWAKPPADEGAPF